MEVSTNNPRLHSQDSGYLAFRTNPSIPQIRPSLHIIFAKHRTEASNVRDIRYLGFDLAFIATRIPGCSIPSLLSSPPPPPCGENIPRIPWISRIKAACGSSFEVSWVDLYHLYKCLEHSVCFCTNFLVETIKTREKLHAVRFPSVNCGQKLLKKHPWWMKKAGVE